jgi:diguanylate cyclase (GGDEF)-like protein
MARRNPILAPLLDTEGERLAALRRYRVLDTSPEPVFDRTAAVAAQALKAPIALISLVDEARQWFKARVGLPVAETPREHSFCAHALDRTRPLVVTDARADPRFAGNPLVLGEPGIRFYAGAPLRTTDGHVLGTLCVIDRRPRELSADQARLLEDLAAIVMDTLELRLAGLRAIDEIAERQRLEGELRHVAETDALTGLANRRSLIRALAREFRRARRHDHGLAVLIFDLDRFKAVNDTHGHATGDAVLRETARRALGGVRDEDTVGRIGGEEFVVVLPETDQAGARHAAERLRLAIGDRPMAVNGLELTVTVSVGAATLHPLDEGHKVLLGRADEALYDAKQAGRNRVAIARPPADDG